MADGAYCSKYNFATARLIGAESVIADNPRKKGKSCKVESNDLLRSKRYVDEQFNGYLKAIVLDDCWVGPKGLAKKARWFWLA